MVDTVGFSAVGAANTAFDLRNSSSAGASAAAEPASAPAAPQVKAATYYSPSLHFDQAVDQLIIQYRNPDNGDVERQYPSRQAIQQYQQAQQRQTADAAAKLEAAPTVHAPQPSQATIHSSRQGASISPVKVTAPAANTANTAPASDAKAAPHGGDSTSSRGITA